MGSDDDVPAASALEEQLAVLGLTLSPEELSRLAECCAGRGIDAEEAAERWASIALSAPEGANSFERLLVEFRKGDRDDGGRSPRTTAASPRQIVDSDVLADYLPVTKIKTEHPNEDLKNEFESKIQAPVTYAQTASRSEKYSNRTNPGAVMFGYGDEDVLAKSSWIDTNGEACHVRQVSNFSDSILGSKAMFGFELLHKKAGILDNNITYLSQYILKKAKIREVVPVTHKSQVPITITGRIECDSNGRLNAKSVLLQGAMEMSFGRHIPVDIDQMKQYTLFPGQVVAMTGLNMHGNNFIAQEVFSDASFDKPSAPVLHNSMNGPLQIVVASGPFTTSESLTYDPLNDLIQYVSQNKPHVLILIGPFLDASHPLVVENTLAETFKSFFENLIDKILTSVSSASPHTRVVLVSSARDVFHVNVYPTLPFHIKKNYSNLTLAPDPCVLNISGVNIGVTGTDILMHLSKEEISMPLQGQDKLGRLAGQLLNQQNFYPLWPPNMSVPLDTTLWNDYASLPFTPHIMILPSDFRYFAKNINGCVVLNPERLTKGTGGGTFARIQINSSTVDNILCQILRI